MRKPIAHFAAREKFLADIYQLARQRLANTGVNMSMARGSLRSTASEAFFSYRRATRRRSRMASFIWLI